MTKMFHKIALKLGLSEPNVHDVVEKLVNKYFENLEYVKFSYSDKEIMVDGSPMKLSISNGGHEYDLILYEPMSTYWGDRQLCDCQFIANHLSEIQDILEDMAKNGKTRYENAMKERQQRALEEERRKQQEEKCLTKMWRYLE